VDRISATGAGHSAETRPDESRSRASQFRSRNHRRQLRRKQPHPGGRRQHSGLTRTKRSQQFMNSVLWSPVHGGMTHFPFALIVGLATWRLLIGDRSTRRGFAIYLSVMAIACGLIGAAGFFGGEMLLGQ